MENTYKGVIKPEFFKTIQEKYLFYKNHKQTFDNRIIENNRWYKNQYHTKKEDEMVMPSTSYLFNALANKHADAMDNFPEPNIVEREESDRGLAEMLTKLLPVQLDMCDFKKVYDSAWWYKLKNGASCYGVFFNPKLGGGIGDIDIKKIDLLNLFWEPGISDIEDSRFIFLTRLTDNEALKEQYPDKKSAFSGSGIMDVRTYDDGQNTNQSDSFKDKSLIIDCYYKKNGELHLIKYVGDTILAASEDEGEPVYNHGMYPFVFDVMFPDEDSPVGFGLIDIIKNPQMYIDKLDHIISRNALVSGKVRWIIKDSGGINEQELNDISKDVIHAVGSMSDDNIRQFQARPMSPYIIQHREKKIQELKEIAGNRDFQQGGTNGGVTAYGAIVALQQAGEKLSRDMIQTGYEAYKNIIYLCIELIRQFFYEPRKYRIDGGINEPEYVSFSSEELNPKTVDMLGEEQYRRPEFSISVVPQKHNPYNKISQNQTLMQLWGMGVFNPQMADSALLLLENMQFDGKEGIINGIRKMKEEAAQAQMMQMQQGQNRGQASGNLPMQGDDPLVELPTQPYSGGM